MNEICRSKSAHFTIQWVPSHCGLGGNERADVLASAGTKLPQQRVPLDMNTAKAVVKRHCAVAWKRELNHPVAIRLLRDGIVSPERQYGLSRRERVILS